MKAKALGIKVAKYLAWLVAGTLLLVLVVLGLLYVPLVQDWVFPVALHEVSKITGMDIEARKVRLEFPLNLTVNDVQIVEATGDTMLLAQEVHASVRPMPLFNGEIQADRLHAMKVAYAMGNEDSVMMLRARIDKAVLLGTSMGLSNGKINLSRGEIDGANVKIVMKDTIVPPTPSQPGDDKWLILVHDLRLKRVTYAMKMMPTIDSVGCVIGDAQLTHGMVDMHRHCIHGEMIDLRRIDADYIAGPGSSQAPVDTVTASSETPWTVKIDKIRLQAHHANYIGDKNDPHPSSLSNFRVADITIAVDSFMNRGTDIRVPLKLLTGRLSRGVDLTASGLFEMDSLEMRASNFQINTSHSFLSFNAMMGMGDLVKNPDTPLQLLARGEIAVADLKEFLPVETKLLPPESRIAINADIDGSPRSLNIYKLDLALQPYLKVHSHGMVENVMDFNNLSGQLSIDGSLSRPLPKPLKALIPLPINIPVMAIKGDVDYSPGLIAGEITATTLGGRIAASGYFEQKAEGYEATLDLDRFPVDAFMPSLGIGKVTAKLEASGEGFNFYKPETSLDASLELNELFYNGERLADVYADASLHDGEASVTLDSENPEADFTLDLTAHTVKDTINYTLDTDIRHLNFHALRVTPDTIMGGMKLSSQGWARLKPLEFQGNMIAENVDWEVNKMLITTPRVELDALASDSLIRVALGNGDFSLNAAFYQGLEHLMTSFQGVMPTIDRQMKQWRFDADSLQRALPPMDVSLQMQGNNLIAQLLKEQADVTIDQMSLYAKNDSLLSANVAIDGFVMRKTQLDKITLDINQHGSFLLYKARIDNEPGTMDEFAHVSLNGYLSADKLSAFLRQENIKGQKGFSLGFNVTVADSVATLRFQPHNPTIAYKPWTLNPDNYISYNLRDRRLKADLSLENDLSYLKLFTREKDNTDSIAHGGSYDEVVLQLSKIKLQDWLSVNPFAPPIKGDLNGDMAFAWDGKDITGSGTVGLKDLYYGRDKVGTFDLGVDLKTNTRGILLADISLMVDSVKTITARGAINDSTATSPFLLDFSMVRFPLHVVNPFLPPGTAKLSGMLNGSMTVSGDPAHPRFDGYVNFDTTGVKVTILGTTFMFSDEKIPVDSNVVHFNDFAIHGCNANPLVVNGTVDASNLANMKIDLGLNAQNFMIVNSNRPRGADVYGKGSIDLTAQIRGDMRKMDVTADLALLEGSSVTYVVPDASATLSQRSNSDMVHFVRLADTVQVVEVDTVAATSMALSLDATVSVRPQTTITVDLSSDGKNRVQVQAAGTLEYTMSPLNGDNLIGKLYILGGFVRYTPPLMTEKRFDFQEGSFINFTGPMLNPTINVTAIDHLKANVTQKGQNSRLVNFDVVLSVSGTLETLKVSFNLTTDDDITVQNELQSMSPEQRANQAMNMLLYNVYTGAGTTGNSNLSGNPLYAFLESTLNTWMANNVRGVDISFGIDQYDKTYEGASTTATSYSYQVSKTLFDNRVKIVVGGNYSTDANADENFSQNLINDISFEYMLNRSGSMYIRLFRHNGFVSILEGEVTQTGVGFVIKRSLNSLRDLFRFGRKEPAVRKEEKK